MPKRFKSGITLPSPFGCKLIIWLGFLFVVAGIAFAIRTELFIHRSATIQGKVVKLVDKQDDNGHTLYAPEFAYTVNGHDYAVDSSSYSRPAAFTPGQTLEVMYDTSNPQNGRIATFWELHGLEDTFMLVGLCFAGLGYAALKYQQRRPKLHAAAAPQSV